MFKVARPPEVKRGAYFHSFNLQPIKLNPDSSRAVRVSVNPWGQLKDRKVSGALSCVVFNDYWRKGAVAIGLIERDDFIAFEIGFFGNKQDNKSFLG
jgi:hypothetical protein